MKEYYKTDNGVLYHGDCFEIMPEFKIVDLVLTDPPYGIKIGGAKGIIGSANIAQPKTYGECLWDKKNPPAKFLT